MNELRLYIIRLYIIGGTPRATKSIENLETILEADFKDHYSLEVIDVLENPKLAEEEKILATPTVIKSLPLPIRRIIGDLSDSEKVLIGLDLIKK